MQLIQDGESSKKLYAIPCLIRSQDGVELSAGTVIEFQLKIYIVKQIFISNDLQNIYIECTQADPTHLEEELMLEPEEVELVPETNLSDVLKHRSKRAAQENCQILMPSLAGYPFHIKRIVRKHLLIRKLRKTVRQFLKSHDYSQTKNLKIGLIDFDHDMKLLSLFPSPMQQQTSKLSHRIEETYSVIDDLLGSRWDIEEQEQGFRVVLTLDIKISSSFEINLIVQGGLCHDQADTDDYRQQYFRKKVDFTKAEEVIVDEEAFSHSKAMSLLDTPNAAPLPHQDKHLSESGSSRPQSRVSGRTHSTIASSARGPRLQGYLSSQYNEVKCPFPNTLQFGTVPEVITNDEDID